MGVVSKIGRKFQEKKWVGYLPTPYHPKLPQNQPFEPLPPTNPNPKTLIPTPKISPTKIPTTIEIPTHINPNPRQTQIQNIKTPQNPKIIKRNNKLIINNE